MAKPDYDTTLARIAGNIAAGLVAQPSRLNAHPENIAEDAVEIARYIVERVKRRPAAFGERTECFGVS